MASTADNDAQSAQIAALKAEFPRISLMHLKSALREVKTIDEARKWLTHKSRSII